MKLDNLIGKRIILYTRKSFRFQGVFKGYNGQFIEIYDELKKKLRLINIDEVTEFEVDDEKK